MGFVSLQIQKIIKINLGINQVLDPSLKTISILFPVSDKGQDQPKSWAFGQIEQAKVRFSIISSENKNKLDNIDSVDNISVSNKCIQFVDRHKVLLKNPFVHQIHVDALTIY